MPKRPKSPEPVEDSKFLTVVYPYPLNANMEVPNDFKEFMFWLACVAGKDYVFGVHYKPSARGMVIAEVSKKYPSFDKLLGEHRWGEFLRNPSKEERDRKSKIYYCAYSNARAAQKDGWKYLHADDDLFKELAPRNMKIQFPYPSTHWCDVPYEDPTGKSLCRPLPIETKAPPPKPPVIVPGSSTWASRKGGAPPGEGSNQQTKNQNVGPSKKNITTGGNTKGKSKSPINPNAWKTPIIMNPTTPTSPQSPFARSPSANTAPPTSAWEKPLSPSEAESSPGTAMPTPPGLSAPKSPAPPGLGPRSNSSRPTNPRGSSSVTMLQHQFAETSLAPIPSSIPSVVAGISDDEDDSEEEDGFEFPNAASVRSRPPPPSSKSSASDRTKGKSKEEQPEDSWTKAPMTGGRTFRKVIAEEDMCPVHGVLCSKGICSVMKKKHRERERLMKRAEQGGSLRKGGEEGSVQDEGEAIGEKDGGDGVGAWNVKGQKEKGRKGDWGPKKERNAKQRDFDGDNISESAYSTSTRPTNRSTGRGNDWEEEDKGRTGDWGPRKERNAKQRDYGDDNISESAFSTSTRQTASSTGKGSRKGTSAKVAESTVKPVIREEAISKGKGKAKDTRPWSERVEDGDDSELGSIMDFSE